MLISIDIVRFFLIHLPTFSPVINYLEQCYNVCVHVYTLCTAPVYTNELL